MANEVIARMQADIEMLKEKIAQLQCPQDDEGELSDWARKELAIARATPDAEYISMEEIEREFLGQ